jgi:hypothetical protein
MCENYISVIMIISGRLGFIIVIINGVLSHIIVIISQWFIDVYRSLSRIINDNIDILSIFYWR